MNIHYDHNLNDTRKYTLRTKQGKEALTFRPAVCKAWHTLHLTHKVWCSRNNIRGVQMLVLKYLSRSSKLPTLHSRFPRITGNSAADHRCRVGTAGTRAVVGRLLGAGVKAVAAATAQAAASWEVRRWLDPGTQSKAASLEQEKSALGTNSLKLAGLRTQFHGSDQWI